MNNLTIWRFVSIPALVFLVGCNPGNDDSASHVGASDLMSMLAGEFDSGQQNQDDRVAQVSREEMHGWVNRTFLAVDAPAMNAPVLVGSTRYHGSDWTFDDNEFLVWTFSDRENGDIVMSPRRFIDLEGRKIHALVAENLGGFTPDDLEDAISGAACDIVWTPTENGYSGRSVPCHIMSTTQKKMLNWDWRYELSDEALWIEFAGEDEDGKVLDGSPAGKPYRLDRLSGSAEYQNGRYILFNPLDREDYARSIALLEQATAADPDNSAASLMLAYAYIKRNRFEDAIPYLQKAKSTVGTLSAHDQLWFEAIDARVADDYPRDIKAWTEVVNADPEDRWAWYELASIHYRSNQYDESIHAIDQALLAEPDEKAWGASFIYYLHSKSHFRTGDYEKAIATAEPGVRNVATRRASFYRKAMAQIAVGDIDDPGSAFATYREYSQRNGEVNQAAYLTNLSLFFFELGDYEKAVEYAQNAYDLEQGVYQVWALGYSLTEKGDVDNGLNYLNEAVEVYPDNVNVLAAKGWAHYRLGQFDTAQEFLLAARAASPRKNSGVERDIGIVEAALLDPDTPQVPPVRWFGD